MYGFWTGHSPTVTERWTQDSMRLTPSGGSWESWVQGPRGWVRLGVGARASGGWVPDRPPPPQHLPGGPSYRHPFPRSSPFPQSEPSPPIPSARVLLFFRTVSPRESQCTGCPHLSACGQSPGKEAVQGAKAQEHLPEEKDRAGRLILKPSVP